MIKEAIEEIREGLGNLQGIPKKFIKSLIQSNAGENSEVILVKKNAKGVDVTKAAKIAMEPTNKYAGVVLKINDEWAFIASAIEYGEKNRNFQITSINKEERIKRTIKQSNTGKTVQGRYIAPRYFNFEDSYLTATELKDIIDFSKETKVDVYYITIDEKRLAKQLKRKAKLGIPFELSPIKSLALDKFIKSKAKLAANAINKKLDLVLIKIKDSIEKDLAGEENDFDTNDAITGIRDVLANSQKMSYYIKDVKNNGISNVTWSGEIRNTNGYYYKQFKDYIKEIESEINK